MFTSALPTLRQLPHVVGTAGPQLQGSDRTLAPPAGTMPSMAPYRKSLMIIRSTAAVKFETHWEKWPELSNRQLIRPAHSCRLNVTMFAKDQELTSTEESQRSDSVSPSITVDSPPQSESTHRPSRDGSYPAMLFKSCCRLNHSCFPNAGGHLPCGVATLSWKRHQVCTRHWLVRHCRPLGLRCVTRIRPEASVECTTVPHVGHACEYVRPASRPLATRNCLPQPLPRR